jgi:hypothetical protein
MELNPLQKDKLCFGDDLRELKNAPRFTLSYFIDWLKKFRNKDEFLTGSKWFNQLMGNDLVIKMILDGKTEAEISESWKKELSDYQLIRQKYLLYNDFTLSK